MGGGRGPGRSRSRGGGGAGGAALRERGRVAGLRKGAHGRQRGGGGGGALRVELGIGARRNAQRPRVPGHRQDSAATAFSRVPGEAATASSVTARVLVRWLKNAERSRNKIRSAIPYVVWVYCRGSALLWVPWVPSALVVLYKQLLGSCRGRPWKQSGSSDGLRKQRKLAVAELCHPDTAALWQR